MKSRSKCQDFQEYKCVQYSPIRFNENHIPSEWAIQRKEFNLAKSSSYVFPGSRHLHRLTPLMTQHLGFDLLKVVCIEKKQKLVGILIGIFLFIRSVEL